MWPADLLGMAQATTDRGRASFCHSSMSQLVIVSELGHPSLNTYRLSGSVELVAFYAIEMIDIWPYDIFVCRSSILKGSLPMTSTLGENSPVME